MRVSARWSMIHPVIDDRARHAPDKPQRIRFRDRWEFQGDGERAKIADALNNTSFDLIFFALHNKKIKSYDNKELGRNGIAKLSLILSLSLFLFLSLSLCNLLTHPCSLSLFLSHSHFPLPLSSQDRDKKLFYPLVQRVYISIQCTEWKIPLTFEYICWLVEID